MTSARLGAHRLPSVVEVTRSPAPASPPTARGLAVGDNGRGAVVLLDVNAGIVCALQRDTGVRVDEVKVPCAQDPLTPGLVAVDESGRRALVMASRTMHGDSSLFCVNLDARTAEPMHTLHGPGWLVGAFGRKSIAVCEQRLGDAPTFSVFVQGKRVWSAAGMQQPCVPAFLDDDVLALVVCPSPDAVTLTGPGSLCALDLVHGTLAPLTAAEGSRVRVEDPARLVLVVEGGSETVRVRLRT